MRGTELRVFRNIGNQFARPQLEEIKETYKWKKLQASLSLSLFLVLSFFSVKTIFSLRFPLFLIIILPFQFSRRSRRIKVEGPRCNLDGPRSSTLTSIIPYPPRQYVFSSLPNLNFNPLLS